MSKEAIAIKALEALARLGNGDQYGNSTGNVIARTALCEMAEQPAQQEPCGWQFFQDGKWHNGMETNNHRANTEAAGVPVRDVYPSPQAHPSREWVGLTDAEKHQLFRKSHELPKQPAPAEGTLAQEVIGCFNAALIEGLQEALAETTDEHLKDLVERRLMYALYAAQETTPQAQPAQEPLSWIATEAQVEVALKAAHMHSTPESRKDMRRAIEAAHGITKGGAQ